MDFTEKERAILSIVQDNLPDSLTPYADIAAMVGLEEQDVIQLLQSLKEDGTIRRFGASIKHQRTGYNHNAMVAWVVSEDKVDEAGEKAAKHRLVSHCYYRPSSASDWPYVLFTMVHGRSEQECMDAIAEIQEQTGLEEYAILESIKEVKKISMKYFD